LIIRDAIHGSIECTELEEKVIDTPEFQRLRFVRQLSTAHLVYPSASHSRFEHSLGTMHLTSRLARKLGLEEKEVSLLRLAGLLHDLGHPAFSHLGEEVLRARGRPSHEERGRQVIESGSIGKLIEEAGFSLADLRKLMEGKGAGSLITASLGTDRLDYLLRDAHHSGAAYSFVDRDRILETVVLQDGKVRVLEKGIVAAESLLVSRHFMFTAVYRHPVGLIASAMLRKGLHQALEKGLLKDEELEKGTDLEVLASLRESGVELAKRILERRLFKKALVLPVYSAPPKVLDFFHLADAEEQLSSHLVSKGIPNESFVICRPKFSKSVCEVEVFMKDGRVECLENISPLLRSLSEDAAPKALIVATDEKLVPTAAKAAKEFLEKL